MENCKNSEEKSSTVRSEANVLDEKQNWILDNQIQSQPPDNETLDKLSKHCFKFYKSLARQLGVDEDKIDEISRDHINYGSLPEKCYQVFLAWKESGAKPFTNDVLESALRSLNKNATADKYFGKK